MLLHKIEDIDKNIILKVNEPMKDHTSFKVGGPVDVLLVPTSIEKLLEIVKLLKSKNEPFTIMGKGTNLIVKDKGIRGFLIKTIKCTKVDCKDALIIAETGASLAKLSAIALLNSLEGMEFASGIPGTLGGAISMNAGAYGGEMKDIIVSTEYIDIKGNIQTVYGDEHDFGYRHSVFQENNGTILRSKIKLKLGNSNDIKNKMLEFNSRRKEKQPLEMPCAGSIFKRPEGFFAGKLIEDAGLKGFQIGGAMVSTKHCGFIVNTGNSTAEDIINLLNFVQEEVLKKFGVKLQSEVKIIGED